LGYGHDEAWWREFAFRLRAAGYDDVLSIEHEDFVVGRLEGVRKSVELLQNVILREPASYQSPTLG
jgi:sugar phosphate isomerase/epimerase